MRIGLTFRLESAAAPYREALRHVGLEAVDIVPGNGVESLEGLDGLLVSGGTDVDPVRYGETPHSKTDRDLDPVRDSLEIGLLNQAIGQDMPVLAICRGMQILNVARGGSLIQHLETSIQHATKPKAEDRELPVHPVTVCEGSVLEKIVESRQYGVNSRHHQAVRQTGEGLVIAAEAADGVVEGIELPDRRFVVGVQWHPENCLASNPNDLRLFQAFAAAVRGAAV